MNIQLKADKIFIHPETGQEMTRLFGGMKHLNVSIDDWTLNFQIKFYDSQELMNEGKQPILVKTFSVNNNDEQNPEFYSMLLSNPEGETIKDAIENAVYNYVLQQPEFVDFEII